MKLNVENAKKVLEKYLGNNEKKYKHSIRVAEISVVLAKKWNILEENAEIAALLHDIGKSYNRKQMLEYCSKNNITMYDFEIFDNISALHGRISADIMEEEFLEDKESNKFKIIQNAVKNHVAGNKNMTELDKIIFISDNIEPEKRDSDLLKNVLTPNVNLDDIIKEIIERKKERSKDKKREANPLFDNTLENLEI